MSSGFLLVETVPGREGQVLELLSRMQGVSQRALLFPAAIAVKFESAREAVDPFVAELRRLEGVVNTRLYRAKAG